jgi:predicted NUDIX family NTP pyrophosphohydrolase
MPNVSAGVLGWRRRDGRLELLLVHPGGPSWAHRDLGAWSIPKGLVEPGETPEVTALRELHEETGWVPDGPLVALGTIRQKAGKIVHAFAAPLDVDPATLVSVTFAMEWPPRSGRTAHFPEVDRAAWFHPATAARQILEAQAPLLERCVLTLCPHPRA